MGLLTKLKSLLGLDEDRSQVRRTDSGVTIERDPEESAEPDAETESAVKGVDTGAEAEASEESFETDESAESEDSGAETGISTEDIRDIPDETDEEDVEETRVQDATEPGEATQPSTDAGQPVQTEGTEPEPTPDATEDESVSETDAEAEASAETEVETETEDEAESPAEEDVADEPIGEGEPLEEIKGIGPAYAERLREAGVPDIAALAKADAEQLALETDLSEKRISGWIERAESR